MDDCNITSLLQTASRRRRSTTASTSRCPPPSTTRSTSCSSAYSNRFASSGKRASRDAATSTNRRDPDRSHVTTAAVAPWRRSRAYCGCFAETRAPGLAKTFTCCDRWRTHVCRPVDMSWMENCVMTLWVSRFTQARATLYVYGEDPPWLELLVVLNGCFAETVEKRQRSEVLQ